MSILLSSNWRGSVPSFVSFNSTCFVVECRTKYFAYYVSRLFRISKKEFPVTRLFKTAICKLKLNALLYIGIFPHLSIGHSTDPFLLKRSVSQLMTQQKSVLVFAVQDVSWLLILIYVQSRFSKKKYWSQTWVNCFQSSKRGLYLEMMRYQESHAVVKEACLVNIFRVYKH